MKLALVLSAGILPLAMSIAPAVQAQDMPAVKTPTAADYAALAKLPDWTGTWQPDWGGLFGRTPIAPPTLTPAAKKAQDDFNAAKARGENLQTAQANCTPPGMPGIMRQPYPIEFIYSPGRVTIAHETYSQVRRIYTDGRPQPQDPDPAYNGWSIGHWEGDTLVVETIGLDPATSLMEGIHPTEQTRIVERIRITQPDLMTIETAITDPTLFVGTYNLRNNYIRHRDWIIREYVCEQNNRDASDEQGKPSLNIDR
ncbi:MAG: hypothetical protein J0G94_18790 [Sphingomonadales bacterium]|nr:hypothetical protein [Sphingomonadales bacterium]